MNNIPPQITILLRTGQMAIQFPDMEMAGEQYAQLISAICEDKEIHIITSSIGETLVRTAEICATGLSKQQTVVVPSGGLIVPPGRQM